MKSNIVLLHLRTPTSNL